ncbi:hypothetical protein HDU97_006469 [Phlyctochytrium planicorne]|nr:hypothetical protein HDU97_006469 [Phlyctochytrium planicorne]
MTAVIRNTLNTISPSRNSPAHMHSSSSSAPPNVTTQVPLQYLGQYNRLARSIIELSQTTSQIDTQGAIVQSLLCEYKHHLDLMEQMKPQNNTTTSTSSSSLPRQHHERETGKPAFSLFSMTMRRSKSHGGNPTSPSSSSSTSLPSDTTILGTSIYPSNIDMDEWRKSMDALDLLAMEQRKLEDLKAAQTELYLRQEELGQLFQQAFLHDKVDSQAVSVLEALQTHLVSYRSLLAGQEEAKSHLEEAKRILEDVGRKLAPKENVAAPKASTRRVSKDEGRMFSTFVRRSVEDGLDSAWTTEAYVKKSFEQVKEHWNCAKLLLPSLSSSFSSCPDFDLIFKAIYPTNAHPHPPTTSSNLFTKTSRRSSPPTIPPTIAPHAILFLIPPQAEFDRILTTISKSIQFSKQAISELEVRCHLERDMILCRRVEAFEGGLREFFEGRLGWKVDGRAAGLGGNGDDVVIDFPQLSADMLTHVTLKSFGSNPSKAAEQHSQKKKLDSDLPTPVQITLSTTVKLSSSNAAKHS